MLHANLQLPSTYAVFLGHPVFVRAMGWLKAMPVDQPDGVIELNGKDMYVNVHRYETLDRGHCAFESHRRYIDVQYCLEGGELIDVAGRRGLAELGDYDVGRDFLIHEPPAGYSTLRMTPGDFAVFFPEDAHRPKVADGTNPGVRKLVIKIALSLL